MKCNEYTNLAKSDDLGRLGSTWVDLGRLGSTWVDLGTTWVDLGRDLGRKVTIGFQMQLEMLHDY